MGMFSLSGSILQTRPLTISAARIFRRFFFSQDVSNRLIFSDFSRFDVNSDFIIFASQSPPCSLFVHLLFTKTTSTIFRALYMQQPS